MSKKKIFLIGTIKSFIFGFTYIFVSKALAYMDVIDLLSFRFLLAALAFYILKLLGVIKVDFKGKKITGLLLVSMFQPVCYYIFETIALSQVSSLLSGIIVASTPVAVLIGEAVFLKERATGKQTLFLILSTAGVVLMGVMLGNDGTRTTIAGVLFLILAVASDACYILTSRSYSSQFEPMEMTFFMMVSGGIVFNLINIARKIFCGTILEYFAPVFNVNVVLLLLYLGVLASCGGYVLCNIMLSKTQATQVASFAGLSMIVSIFAGIFINHEEFLWYHFVGTVCILIGILGVAKYRRTSNVEGK